MKIQKHSERCREVNDMTKFSKVVTFLLAISLVMGMIPTKAYAAAKSYAVTDDFGTLIISGEKVWKDSDDALGVRPDSVEIELCVGDTVIKTTEATAANGWKYSFDISNEKIVDENGNAVVYTVREKDVPKNYEVSYVQPTLSFTYPSPSEWGKYTRCDKLEIPRTKVGTTNQVIVARKGNSYVVWSDEPLSQSQREAIYASFSNAPGAGNSKSGSFICGVGATEQGFTVNEENIVFDSKSSWSLVLYGTYSLGSADSVVINTIKTIEINAQKVWDDADNQDGKRPESITINLLANGEKIDSKIVDADSQWACKFEGLTEFDKEGNQIQYTVGEEAVDGYTATVNGFIITNTYIPETIEVSGSKTWNDFDNKYGVRPESIIINLHANGELVDSKIVTEADDWAWTFTDLPKYEAGVEIEYTIVEQEVEGYDSVVEGYDVINNYVQNEEETTEEVTTEEETTEEETTEEVTTEEETTEEETTEEETTEEETTEEVTTEEETTEEETTEEETTEEETTEEETTEEETTEEVTTEEETTEEETTEEETTEEETTEEETTEEVTTEEETTEEVTTEEETTEEETTEEETTEEETTEEVTTEEETTEEETTEEETTEEETTEEETTEEETTEEEITEEETTEEETTEEETTEEETDEEERVEVIFDERIPMSDIPETGDVSGAIWSVVAALSGMMMIGTGIIRHKKKDENIID